MGINFPTMTYEWQKDNHTFTLQFSRNTICALVAFLPCAGYTFITSCCRAHHDLFTSYWVPAYHMSWHRYGSRKTISKRDQCRFCAITKVRACDLSWFSLISGFLFYLPWPSDFLERGELTILETKRLCIVTIKTVDFSEW